MAKKKEAYTQQAQVGEVKTNKVEQYDLFNIFNNEERWYIALGNQVVTRKTFASREEAQHYVDCKPWELIFNSVAVMFENLNKIAQNQNNK